MIHVGIVGSEGYAVGELYSLLLNHPDVRLDKVYAPNRRGMKVSELFNDLRDYKSLTFTDEDDFEGLDLLFICLPTGHSERFQREYHLPPELKLIDFSHEHRLSKGDGYVYGLPEAYREEIMAAQKVSVPGSLAMAIELPLIPLAKNMVLNHPLHINSVAGKTEAFARPTPDTTLSYEVIFDNFHVFNPFNHSHEEEVKTILTDLQKSFKQELNLIPMRGNYNRGIYTTAYLNTHIELSVIRQMYEEYFEDKPFVKIVDEYPDVRDTVNTNDLLIHVSKHADRLLIVSTMDNLMKGAAGNAIQIMNLMFGLVETTGLQIKPSVF